MFPKKTCKAKHVQPLRPANSLATCDICGKKLARQSDMPRHKRLHDPKPDRWMHWCPEPGCDYGSMQRSNLRNHIRKHTGQWLRCPDDSTCNYSTFDKSALLRHRQRRHGYQTKSTASKDRRMKATGNGTGSSRKLDNHSFSSPAEPVRDRRCPCFSSSSSNRRAYGAIDEMDIWQGDHAPQETVTEQLVGSSERSPEGHVTSRFPVSFARTRLPHAAVNGALLASKHRCTCNMRSDLTLPTHSNRTGLDTASQSHGAYRRVSHFVKEAVFLATC